jgi:hypothetical protein
MKICIYSKRFNSWWVWILQKWAQGLLISLFYCNFHPGWAHREGWLQMNQDEAFVRKWTTKWQLWTEVRIFCCYCYWSWGSSSRNLSHVSDFSVCVLTYVNLWHSGKGINWNTNGEIWGTTGTDLHQNNPAATLTVILVWLLILKVDGRRSFWTILLLTDMYCSSTS